MRRAVLATAATVSGLVALLALKPHEAPVTAAAPPPARAPGSGSTSGANGAEADTVTGRTVQTQYGPVEVEVTLSKGKITNVRALQVPPEHADAVPQLTQAALAAQSAEIDAVSGATYTSEGYKESLQSALDQAAASTPSRGNSSGGNSSGGSPEGSGDGSGDGYAY
jgi:uncharacterized protein with FMN-binding domain